MKILSRHRSTASLAIACLSLFVALGGIGYAAVTINGKTIQNKTIAGKKLINKTVGGGKVKSNTLGGTQINESKLGKVPSAVSADSAANAQNAANAQHASDTDSLGGVPAGSYAKTDTRGIATAGAVVTSAGDLKSWFNRAGGAPIVKDTGEGDWEVIFPGVEPNADQYVATATVIGVFGMATVDYSGVDFHVRTFLGNLAADTFDAKDRMFTLLVHPSGAAG